MIRTFKVGENDATETHQAATARVSMKSIGWAVRVSLSLYRDFRYVN